jgi:hypothetical protein
LKVVFKKNYEVPLKTVPKLAGIHPKKDCGCIEGRGGPTPC